MANTFVPLAKSVLTGTASSISFNTIPGTYTDLVIFISARTDRPTVQQDPIKIRFNGAGTDSNLSPTYFYASGTSVGASGGLSYGLIGYATCAGSTSNTFSNIELYLPNYAGSTNKMISSTSANEHNATSSNELDAIATSWNSTAAITSITLLPNTGPNFISGSRFDLYGILKS